MTDASSDVFATLRPIGLAARVEFSKAVTSSQMDPTPAWAQSMMVDSDQTYDHEYALQCEAHRAGREVDSDASATDADTDTEDYRRAEFKLWNGHYVFRSSRLSDTEDAKWIMGRGRPNHPSPHRTVDFKLMQRQIRGWHVRFTFRGHFLACTPATQAADAITVNGQQVSAGEWFSFNQDTALLTVGGLSFQFAYADYARSDEFSRLRQQYWTQFQNRRMEHANISELALFPMPPIASRMVGQYTLATEIGKGVAGKVYSATDSKGTVFAIKMIERNRRSAYNVLAEVRALQELTPQVEAAGCTNIVRLKEILGDLTSNTCPLLFKDIYLVLQPAAYATLGAINQHNTPLLTRLHYFHGLLQGLEFLHFRHWVHRDVKETNVGIYQDRAVLLDLGGAKHLKPPSMSIPATPGCAGTINYLAPEVETTGSRYDCSADIWAAGIVGYILVHSCHPLCLSSNPWRQGNEALLPEFHTQYGEMRKVLRFPHPNAPGVNGLLMRMMSSDKIECNHGPRISADAALQHQCWQVLTPDDAAPPSKKSG
ncbi:hypothetical protein NX059_012449 [Plenodomus lindquistii]|nr:hypothetical protein NX059_012449 [Plenodomus lindquistii]